MGLTTGYRDLLGVPTLVTSWTIACQASLSMGFPRQKYWSGLPFPSPGDLPNPGGIALQAMQEKKALSSRGRGRLRGFLELRRPWGFSPEGQASSRGEAKDSALLSSRDAGLLDNQPDFSIDHLVMSMTLLLAD